jgi:hypothetical protein
MLLRMKERFLGAALLLALGAAGCAGGAPPPVLPVAAAAPDLPPTPMTFVAERAADRWTLRDRHSAVACSLPCARLVPVNEVLSLHREQDGASTAQDLRVPTDPTRLVGAGDGPWGARPLPPGAGVRVVPRPARGNRTLAGVSAFIAILGGVVGTGFLITTLAGRDGPDHAIAKITVATLVPSHILGIFGFGYGAYVREYGKAEISVVPAAAP